MPKMINTAVELDETLHMRLKALGALKDRTPHGLIRAAIEEYVTREEACEQEKREDLERWRRYKATGHVITHEQATAWLASIGTDSELPCPK